MDMPQGKHGKGRKQSPASRASITPMCPFQDHWVLAQHLTQHPVFSHTVRFLFCQQLCYAWISFRFIQIQPHVKLSGYPLFHLIYLRSFWHPGLESHHLSPLVPVEHILDSLSHWQVNFHFTYEVTHLKIHIKIVKMFGPCMVEILNCDVNVIRHLVLYVNLDKVQWEKCPSDILK